MLAAQQQEAPKFLFEWGPFQALELVGEGGFGQVYRAFDTRLRREVALKLRRADVGRAGEGTRRFLEEARHLARVRHSNVLVVHGADVHDRRAGFWTDFIRGRTLADLLQERGTLSSEESARIGVDLCRALRAVHAAELVHGDLKPANVMCESSGRILLMDFGAVTRVARASGEGAPVQLFGTPAFLAPEVLRGDAPTPRADLYALGVLLHVMVGGALPFEGATIDELMGAHARGDARSEALHKGDLSPALVECIERALRVDPIARYASAEEMERALAGAAPSTTAEESQSLRALVDELGQVPEKLCLSIGAQIARALLRMKHEVETESSLGLEQLLLLPDGRVRFTEEVRPRGAPAAIGRALEELATGVATDSSSERGLARPLSPFLQELIRSLRKEEPDPELRDLTQLWSTLNEGEASTWWRARRRELRRSAIRRPPRPALARDTALYGREQSWAELRRAFALARGGEGQVLLLTGEAGIGKTRLIGEWLEQLEREGEDFQYLFGSYAPSAGVSEAGAFLDAYRGFLGEADFEEALADYLVDAPLLLAPLRALLAGRVESSEANRSSLDLVQRALVQLTQAIAAARPTVIWIDDLHFASSEGRDLFAALAQAAADHRILLLGTARPTLPVEWCANLLRLEHAGELPIPRLEEGDVRRLLADALASLPLAEEMTPGLIQRSDGNPLFLLEYLRALDASGDLSATALDQARRRLSDLSTPGSVQRMIQARCSAIAEEDQEVLDVASCLGFEFEAELVARALGQDVLPVLRRLAAIERRHALVRSSGRRFVFDHHEIHQALYGGLFEPLREQYHAALARAVESREGVASKDPSTLSGAIAAFIAEHFLRGGEGESARRYLQPAIKHLEGTYAHDAAVRLADLALLREGFLTGLARVEILVLKARSLSLQGHAAEEEATLREQFRLAEESGDRKARAEAHVLLGDLALRRSRIEEAHALLDSGRRLGEEVQDLAVQYFAAVSLGMLHFRGGRLDEARSACERGLELARARGNARDEATAAGHLGIMLGSQGKHEEARSYFQQSLALAREVGYALAEALAVCSLGVVLDSLGSYQDAIEYHRQYLDLSRKLGFRRGQGSRAATGHMRSSRSGAPPKRWSSWSSGSRCFARCTIRRGDRPARGERRCLRRDRRLAQARAEYEEAVRLAKEHRVAIGEADMRIGLAGVARSEGQHEEAQAGIAAAQAIYERVEHEAGMAAAWLELGRLSLARGQRGEARERMEQAFSLARGAEATNVALLAGAHLAALSGGASDELRELLPQYGARSNLFARMEARYLLWHASGDPSDLEEARRLYREFESGAPAAYRETMRTVVPLHRGILEGRPLWS
ncbi:MAG: tetratricopeptide repeat protein [Candidatus Eisenbacteria bacterium]